MKNSKIEWTHHTFNPWLGCTKVSPACTHCYAEAWAKRSGLVKWGDAAPRRRTSTSYWREPLKWHRLAEQDGQRRRVFCASLADVFEDRPELRPWRVDLIDLIEQTPALDWLLLTKRPDSAADLWPDKWRIAPQPNVWIGTTVENQEQAEKHIPHLWHIPARTRFLSCEPLLGSINLGFALAYVDWVIVGGESGPGARPMLTEWARSLLHQCKADGADDVAFHFKQWGEYVHYDQLASYDYEAPRGKWDEPDWFDGDGPGDWFDSSGKKSDHRNDDATFYYRVGKARAGRKLDGREWNEYPQPRAAQLPDREELQRFTEASRRLRGGDFSALKEVAR